MHDLSNALLFSVVGNAGLVSCDGQLSFRHWNIQLEPSSYIFHKFNASLTKARSHGFVGLLLLELLPCFNVFAFQIFKRFFNRNFREFFYRLALNVDVECTSPWSLSGKFSALSEVNDFFGFLRLAVADENGHDLFFFSKAFEPILRHKLRKKVTPLYLVICFVTCWHTKLLQNDRTSQRVIKTINV